MSWRLLACLALAGCTCPAGQIACDVGCRDPGTDSSHCGACGVACAPSDHCVDARCIDRSFDGSCMGRCDLGDEICRDGECVCAPGRAACGSRCVDLATDRSACGACNRQCARGASCVDGACSCGSGIVCDGACVNASSDPANCGACGETCPDGVRCVGGQCDCPGALGIVCGDRCVDAAIDWRHCGGCDQGCEIGCFEGACPVVAELHGGGHHTCVTLDDGRVACWGDNSYGQLGLETRSDYEEAVVTNLIGTVDGLAIGAAHTCARSGSDVWCWGSNTDAELGAGYTSSSQPLPVRVPDLAAGRIFAGNRATCALVRGVPYCWGNRKVLTGHPLATGEDTQPAPWGASSDVVDVVMAGRICTRTADGRVYCNLRVNGETSYPNLVPEWTGAAQVVVGGRFACARLGGRVSCVGANDVGQLGGGMVSTAEAVPVEPSIPGTIIDVSAGAEFACAANAVGDVYCWGENTWGQLAEPDRYDRAAPIQVRELENVRDLECGLLHCCAWVDGADVRCWGRNDDAQTGISPHYPELYRATPQRVPLDLR